MLAGLDEPRAEVERILQSETFHYSGVLRRLLRFLADKAFAGEADQLNEYAIGIDALGKPSTYDPRQDAIVRLQIGRLRQKLGDYYRNEGKDNPILIDLPKGRFRLKWQSRPIISETPTDRAVETHATVYWRWAALALGSALVASLAWGAYSTRQLVRERETSVQATVWTPELEQLWKPFLASKRPVVIGLADPLFVGLQGTDVYLRKISLRRPEDAEHSPEVAALRKVMGNPAIQPTFNFTPSGEVNSSFLLGKLLGTRRQDITLARGTQIQLQALSESNAILVGPAIAFAKLSGIQLQPELTQVTGGVRNLHPRQGEPEFYSDAPGGLALDNGEVYALISHVPGPLGNSDVEAFTSTRTWGREGAIQAFTNPDLARTLLQKLRGATGEIPRYYQIVVRVRFWDGLPLNVSYVSHRAIAAR